MSELKEGEEFSGVVDAIGVKGDPIIKVDGFAVFVQNCSAQEGDTLDVKVTRVLKQFAFAEEIKN